MKFTQIRKKEVNSLTMVFWVLNKLKRLRSSNAFSFAVIDGLALLLSFKRARLSLVGCRFRRVLILR